MHIFFQKFTEGYCRYQGLGENLPIGNYRGCSMGCNLDEENCAYFVFKNVSATETNCQFTTTTNFKCDLIRGPPTPPMDSCTNPTPPPCDCSKCP